MNIFRIKLVLWLFLSTFVVTAQPVADFTANIQTGCGSLQVSFQDQSTGNITDYEWNLGGVSSMTQNPGRIFGTPGSYEVCLTVTDTDGMTNTNCKSDYIRVFHLPEPDFSIPDPNGCIPFQVTFTDLSTSQDGNINEWIWGVGGEAGVIMDDGTLPSIENTYEIIDDYTISLTVIDDNGCINTITKDNFLSVNENPVVDFIADETFSCNSPHTVNFLNTSVNPNMTFQWDFGNGQSFNGANPQGVIYNNQGLYDVRLTGTDNVTGCKDTLLKVDYIQLSYPTDFTQSSDTICKGETISFTDTSPDDASNVFWDFGDGQNSVNPNPTHQYDSTGCFFVILTRTVDGCPGVKVSEQCIQVLDVNPLSITNNNPMGCMVPHTANFFSDAPVNGSTFEWDFGNGSTSNETSPQYTYDSIGVYIISLSVTNSQGCVETSTDTIQILPAQAIIVGDEKEGCTPLSFTLSDSSKTFSPITQWEWTVFNNASAPPITFSSNDSNPVFTLVDTGQYAIQLVIQDEMGCRDTTIVEEGAGAGMPPEVSFSAQPLVSCINSVVTFTDESSDFANGWEWDFGDGGLSEDQHPIYEYQDTGRMDVRLTALHHGCPAQETLLEYIEVVPPKAAFQINRLCSQLYIIDFTDRSIGADSIIYDFGVPGIETDTTSERDPTFTYQNTGDYFVSQIAFNFTTGCSDTLLRLVQITEPQAQFQLTTTEGCVPLTVGLSDSSSFAESWIWSGGGTGIISDPEAAEPTITFNTPGPYTNIQLLVTDINGCQDSIVFLDTIWVNEVSPNFSVAPSEGCFPLNTEFIDASTSLYGIVNHWEWDFGDGQINDQLSNPTHLYEEEGYFDVMVTATDDIGCSATLKLDSLVEVYRPIASFITLDTLSCSAHAVNFSNTSTGKGLNFHWDFGDGQTSTEEEPNHTYVQEGTYDICLTVTDGIGCDNTLCRDAYVIIADPLAAFTQDTTAGICPPLLVNFTNTSQNSLSYEWNFGDMSGTSNQIDPPHIYTMPGIYDVQLIAVATEFCQDTLLLNDLINLNGPTGNFHFDIDTACVPATINFVGSSMDPYTYIWDFGNGMLDTTENVTYDSIFYEYQRGGDFIPKLILVDQVDCQTTIVSEKPIIISEMNLDFQADRTLFCNDLGMTNFTNLTSSTHPISELEWQFIGSDPVISTAPEPSVNYTNPGSFSVQLFVSNGICSDSLLKVDYIGVGAIPEVAFQVTDSVGCAPLTVNFQDDSTVDSSEITAWNWNFANFDETDIESPVFIFNQPGIHEITLTATSAVGCQDSVSRTVEVLEIPTFSIAKPESICIGQNTILIPEFIEDTTGYQFQWVNHPDLSCVDCLTPSVNPVDTTIYHLAVTNTLGCTTTEAVTVDVRPVEAPIITISQDTSICLNDFVQLNVSGGNNLHEYQWGTDSEGLSCYDACINPIASPLVSTNFEVTITNEFGCATTDSVRVNISNEYQPLVGDDQTICAGDQFQFNVTTGSDPTWLVTDGLDCTYCPNPVAQPDSTTVYRVRAITDQGCELLDTIEIKVIPLESIDAGVDQQICHGSSTILNGSGTGAVIWSPAQTVSSPNTLETEVRPNSNTIYTLSLTEGNCTLVDSVSVTLTEKTTIETEDLVICEGEIVELDYEGLADQINWFDEQGNLIDSFNVQPIETTNYTIIGQYTTCEPDTASILVEVTPKPITYLPEILTYIPGTQIQIPLTVPDSVLYEYQWMPADSVDCTNCQQPEIRPDSNTVYQVLITDLMTGCTLNDSIRFEELITCPSDLIWVPNAFSPNGDGDNDYLQLFPNPSIKSINRFRVFNRWGAILYETDDLFDQGWDGKIKGKQAPVGVYIFMIEFNCELTNQTVIHSGDVTLFR